jgi:hypothetical protein
MFEANPEKYYPTEFFKGIDFSRHTCAKCAHFFWKYKDNDTLLCGDSK